MKKFTEWEQQKVSPRQPISNIHTTKPQIASPMQPMPQTSDPQNVNPISSVERIINSSKPIESAAHTLGCNPADLDRAIKSLQTDEEIKKLLKSKPINPFALAKWINGFLQHPYVKKKIEGLFREIGLKPSPMGWTIVMALIIIPGGLTAVSALIAVKKIARFFTGGGKKDESTYPTFAEWVSVKKI